jgi:hypothetical protein
MLRHPRRIQGWRINEFAKETISKTFGQSVLETIGTGKEILIMLFYDTASYRKFTEHCRATRAEDSSPDEESALKRVPLIRWILKPRHGQGSLLDKPPHRSTHALEDRSGIYPGPIHRFESIPKIKAMDPQDVHFLPRTSCRDHNAVITPRSAVVRVRSVLNPTYRFPWLVLHCWYFVTLPSLFLEVLRWLEEDPPPRVHIGPIRWP